MKTRSKAPEHLPPAPPPLSDNEPVTVIVGRECPPATALEQCLCCRDLVPSLAGHVCAGGGR
ncbi:hypothetical protein [Streptomyces radicis]|uniref:Uncharacterized protein n=1 Tax=Streptomyces radicis TaxID=1750517 RepID=A0A3A9W4V7_9ACTN|nr:hypothetical protein [Streptomyces radicis]RKN07909.1 hypothetical protein D7319_17775 [Streptomyces radicis]RKN20637.1 hypothetical protein D7318_17145 [Streptomyces radicis]